MSQGELERFVNDVKEKQDLKDELKKIGADLSGIVDLAIAQGYSFTVDELENFVSSKKGELSEEQLSKISGGDVAWAYVAVVVVA